MHTMIIDDRPQLPGTLHGLLDAGNRLYTELQTSDAVLAEALASLVSVERAIERGESVASLRFEIGATLRVCFAGRERVGATLRRFTPGGAAEPRSLPASGRLL